MGNAFPLDVNADINSLLKKGNFPIRERLTQKASLVRDKESSVAPEARENHRPFHPDSGKHPPRSPIQTPPMHFLISLATPAN